MIEDDWVYLFEKELLKGEQAKKVGNEGMARVCARRAVGHVIREYLKQNRVNLPRLSNFLIPGASALNHIKFFCDDPDVPSDARKIAAHFLLQITTDHTLPGNPNLLADARWLAGKLLGYEIE